MSKIHILHVLWDDDFGGVERHVLDLLTNIDRSEFDCELCILHDDKNRIAKGVRELGIPVHHANLRSGFDICGMWRFIKFARKKKFDVIHSHIYPLWMQLAVGCLLKSINIVRLHGQDVVEKSTFRSIVMNRLSRFVTDGYVTPSEIHKTTMVKLYYIPPAKIHVLHHGIDTSRFCPLSPSERVKKRRELGINEGDFAIGNVGRLAEQKNLPCFIRASVLIHDEMPNTRFFIVGYGELEEKLRQAVKKEKAEDYIIFLGRRTDIREILGAWDVFMFTTWVESFGLVALEAMAAGLPLVASNSTSLPEVVGDTGILIGIDDHEAFAIEVIKLLKNDEMRQRMAHDARERAVNVFSMDVMIGKMSIIYKTLMATKHKQGRQAKSNEAKFV